MADKRSVDQSPSPVNLSPVELGILRHLDTQSIPDWMFVHFTSSAVYAVGSLIAYGLATICEYHGVSITADGMRYVASSRAALDESDGAR